MIHSLNKQKNWEEKIRHICSYWSEPDEVSGKESAGTAGYCLSEEQFQKLFSFFASSQHDLIESVISLAEEMKIDDEMKMANEEDIALMKKVLSPVIVLGDLNSQRRGRNQALSDLQSKLKEMVK